MADRFETAYLEGSPPWDIGRAQPELVSLFEAGLITGRVLFLLCFSERQPADWGPRRVTQRELRETFTGGWHVDCIDEAHFATQLNDAQQVEAWLAVITRI